METDHQDITAYYKALEKECNRIIHSKTNCRSFTSAFGKFLDKHLQDVRVHRMLITERLNYLNFTNKDDIANLSVKWVERIETIDLLDDMVYDLCQRQRTLQVQLRKIRESYDEWMQFLINEQQESRDHQILTLEKELDQLKQLFYTDLEMEEKEND